jgi:CRISPR-associated endoribonuclease Cas6
MFRIFLSIEGRGVRYSYLDSVHAAVVAGLKAAGMSGERLVGHRAHPWTFATKGFGRPGGNLMLKGLTISTPNSDIALALHRLRPVDVCWHSTNGDRIELLTARKIAFCDPLQDGQEVLSICFASPFVLSQPRIEAGPTKAYIESLQGQDLSAAFSKGLSRRLGRPIDIQVTADPLSLATEGARPRIVSLRKSTNRKVTVPAFSVQLTLRGKTDDLRAAYYSGLGEKTRYGFGCPATLN